MVVGGGDLPSETRATYHKLNRPQQLFVDFRIDFINKMLIIGSTIEREPEESAMSELGIYEGCFVRLENGDVIGPMRKFLPPIGPERTLWRCDGEPSKSWWEENGRHLKQNSTRFDIVELVQTVDGVPIETDRFGHLHATIPPHVTKAAMVAGIKADPAYEQFVNAILTAGFKAQYEIGFVPVTEQAPIDMDELCERLASALPAPKPLSECSDEMKAKLRKLGDAAVSYLGDKRFPKNESENRIPDSEKTKGGLSDFLPFYEPGLAEKITDTGREVLKSMLPLNGVTICFTGSMNMPVDTHKGIAEALGAKVSGSVHSKTTLVVFGAGARSKFDKAIELDLPRMSESAWIWMAALLGYGKPDHVSPYGKFPTGGVVGLPIPGTILRSYIVNALDDWANNHSEMSRAEYLARVMEKFISHYVTLQNESENRAPDSGEPQGGLSDLRSEVVKVLRDNDTIRGIGATADAIMKIVEGVQVGAIATPSVREIHDEVLGVVWEWHAKYGRDSMPSTFSIAKAFHRMLTPVATEERVYLVAPQGWYLYECKHEHTAHRSLSDHTVTPSDHPGGAWSVDFQRLANGGFLTGGRGKTLVEAWQNAVAAIKLAEEHGLDH